MVGYISKDLFQWYSNRLIWYGTFSVQLKKIMDPEQKPVALTTDQTGLTSKEKPRKWESRKPVVLWNKLSYETISWTSVNVCWTTYKLNQQKRGKLRNFISPCWWQWDSLPCSGSPSSRNPREYLCSPSCDLLVDNAVLVEVEVVFEEVLCKLSGPSQADKSRWSTFFASLDNSPINFKL